MPGDLTQRGFTTAGQESRFDSDGRDAGSPPERAPPGGLRQIVWACENAVTGGGNPARDGSRDNPLAHVLMGVVAERSVWRHGRRHCGVILFNDTELESGMYMAEPQNIHL